MKSVANTTIICGTSLIVAPIVHNLLLMHMVASLMAKGSAHVDLKGALSEAYLPWCMFIGACVIVSGIVLGVRSGVTSRELPPPFPASHAAAMNV